MLASICVGRHVATNSVFIEIANILWGLNIGPAKNSQGSFVLPDCNDSIDDGLVV